MAAYCYLYLYAVGKEKISREAMKLSSYSRRSFSAQSFVASNERATSVAE